MMTYLIRATLDYIREELDRLYWNKYQKQMDSPFDNTGNEYKNDTFSVYAYRWNDNEDNLPNFSYKGFRAYWYKHSNRGLYWKCDEEVTAEYLEKMIEECVSSIEQDFK